MILLVGLAALDRGICFVICLLIHIVKIEIKTVYIFHHGVEVILLLVDLVSKFEALLRVQL